jgi:signal transduction histidine kinase
MLSVGGILLIFCIALYFVFNYSLSRRLDNSLWTAGYLILNSLQMDQRGGVTMNETPQLDLLPDVYFQVWGRDGKLKYFSYNLGQNTRPLDRLNIAPASSILHETSLAGQRARVLTMPIVYPDITRPIGAVQVAITLSTMLATLQTLLAMLVVGWALGVGVAGLAGWYLIGRTLNPLSLVTQTALQITRADDLSRRIPYQGNPEDEVGQLIMAFNQTLSRLEKLFNSQRRFLVDVGHELRTPLTVIKGNVDLMRRMNCTDDESMEGIEAEVDRLTRLVGDLLLLAQAESGKLPLAHRTVELDSLVLDVMQQMRVLAHDRLKLSLGDFDQVQVCGDQDKLKQVLVNLISNAIKYTPSGGEVVVGLGKLEGQAQITVSDNGPGIPAEDLPYIFERFYRAEKSRTRSKDGKGFGLGLSIAYWIVQNHAGKIEVESHETGGTKFIVWLPLAEPPCPEDTHG